MTNQNHVPGVSLRRVSAVPAWSVFGVECRVLLDGAASGGAHSAARLVCPPGLGAPPHRHVEAETFHVLRGTLTVHADGTRHELHPGDLVHVRPWVVHDFGNESAEPVEFLAFGTPAGHEHFFADADALERSGRFNPETAAEVCRRHGIELVMPPPGAGRPA